MTGGHATGGAGTDGGGEVTWKKAEVREKLADAYYRSSDHRAAMQAYQFLLKSIQARSKDDAPNADLARIMPGEILVPERLLARRIDLDRGKVKLLGHRARARPAGPGPEPRPSAQTHPA